MLTRDKNIAIFFNSEVVVEEKADNAIETIRIKAANKLNDNGDRRATQDITGSQLLLTDIRNRFIQTDSFDGISQEQQQPDLTITIDPFPPIITI